MAKALRRGIYIGNARRIKMFHSINIGFNFFFYPNTELTLKQLGIDT